MKPTKEEQKLWLTVSWDNNPTTFQFMVEVDLNKYFKFVELSNGAIGFTQVDDNDSTTSAEFAQHCSGTCLHTAQCLSRARDIKSVLNMLDGDTDRKQIKK